MWRCPLRVQSPDPHCADGKSEALVCSCAAGIPAERTRLSAATHGRANWLCTPCRQAGARPRQDGLWLGLGVPPHSPGETARGYWRAVFCPAAAEGSPDLTWLEETTHMAALGWEREQEGAWAVQNRRPPPLPGPFFTPAAPRVGQRKFLPSSTEGLGAARCAVPPHRAPGSHQPRSGPICWGVMRSSEQGRGSGKH